MDKGHNIVRASRHINTAMDDRNLPITIDVSLIGDVNRSWSVFCLKSSENTRIVSIGVSSIIINSMKSNIPATDEDEPNILLR
jgi:hypothetical protein